MGTPLKVMTGRKVGRWTVLERASSPPQRSGLAHWLCICDCGTKRIVDGGTLRSGGTHSCGCYRRDSQSKRQTKEDGAFTLVRNTYKASAKQRNLKWSLTDDQARDLFQSPCHYCGVLPYRKSVSWGGKEFVYNGIDRIDSDAGYTLGNTVSSCRPCNVAKMDREYGDFIQWAIRIAELHAQS